MPPPIAIRLLHGSQINQRQRRAKQRDGELPDQRGLLPRKRDDEPGDGEAKAAGDVFGGGEDQSGDGGGLQRQAQSSDFAAADGAAKGAAYQQKAADRQVRIQIQHNQGDWVAHARPVLSGASAAFIAKLQECGQVRVR
jgi:hypothetical protein